MIPMPSAMERRRRGRYLAWGVSPRDQKSKMKIEPPEGATDGIDSLRYLARLRLSDGLYLAT